jgi:hypothetical protein
MTDSHTSQFVGRKLEDTPLWQLSNEVAEHVYARLTEMPEEERWDTTAKLRTAASQLLYNIAVALGNTAPASTEYDWAQANKQLFGLKTMYRFAGRQHFFKIDPDIMLKLDELIRIVEDETAKAFKQSKAASQREIHELETRIKEQKS